MRGLEGKVVVITGATKTMGEAIGRRFVEEGSIVVGCGRFVKRGEAVAVRLRALGGQAVFQQADVTIEDDVRAVVEMAMLRFGRLDVVVNNAAAIDAIRGGEEAGITREALATFDRVIRVGVHGPFLFFKHAIPAMLQNDDGGVFVQLSSVTARRSADGAPAYSASKGALESLTRQVAGEYGKLGIRSNAISMGFIAVPDNESFRNHPMVAAALAGFRMSPRLGDPADVAALCAFLASDDARFLTGAVIALDGGQASKTVFPNIEEIHRELRG